MVKCERCGNEAKGELAMAREGYTVFASRFTKEENGVVVAGTLAIMPPTWQCVDTFICSMRREGYKIITEQVKKKRRIKREGTTN